MKKEHKKAEGKHDENERIGNMWIGDDESEKMMMTKMTQMGTKEHKETKKKDDDSILIICMKCVCDF